MPPSLAQSDAQPLAASVEPGDSAESPPPASSTDAAAPAAFKLPPVANLNRKPPRPPPYFEDSGPSDSEPEEALDHVPKPPPTRQRSGAATASSSSGTTRSNPATRNPAANYGVRDDSRSTTNEVTRTRERPSRRKQERPRVVSDDDKIACPDDPRSRLPGPFAPRGAYPVISPTGRAGAPTLPHPLAQVSPFSVGPGRGNAIPGPPFGTGPFHPAAYRRPSQVPFAPSQRPRRSPSPSTSPSSPSSTSSPYTRLRIAGQQGRIKRDRRVDQKRSPSPDQARHSFVPPPAPQPEPQPFIQLFQGQGPPGPPPADGRPPMREGQDAERHEWPRLNQQQQPLLHTQQPMAAHMPPHLQRAEAWVNDRAQCSAGNGVQGPGQIPQRNATDPPPGNFPWPVRPDLGMHRDPDPGESEAGQRHRDFTNERRIRQLVQEEMQRQAHENKSGQDAARQRREMPSPGDFEARFRTLESNVTPSSNSSFELQHVTQEVEMLKSQLQLQARRQLEPAGWISPLQSPHPLPSYANYAAAGVAPMPMPVPVSFPTAPYYSEQRLWTGPYPPAGLPAPQAPHLATEQQLSPQRNLDELNLRIRMLELELGRDSRSITSRAASESYFGSSEAGGRPGSSAASTRAHSDWGMIRGPASISGSSRGGQAWDQGPATASPVWHETPTPVSLSMSETLVGPAPRGGGFADARWDDGKSLDRMGQATSTSSFSLESDRRRQSQSVVDRSGATLLPRESAPSAGRRQEEWADEELFHDALRASRAARGGRRESVEVMGRGLSVVGEEKEIVDISVFQVGRDGRDARVLPGFGASARGGRLKGQGSPGSREGIMEGPRFLE